MKIKRDKWARLLGTSLIAFQILGGSINVMATEVEKYQLNAIPNAINIPVYMKGTSTEIKESDSVSRVDYDNPKYSRNAVLDVNGKPFYYNGIQIRIDKLRDDPDYAFDSEGLQRVFQQAADDGFTAAASQIRWTDIQPNHQIKAIDTAYVRSGVHGDKNYQGSGGIYVSNETGANDKYQGFIKFSIKDMTPEEIDGAALRLTTREAESSSRKVKIYALKDHSWNRNTITWNNANAKNGFAGEKVLVGETPSYDLIKSQHKYDFFISDLFTNPEYKDYIAADGTISLMIEEDLSTAVSNDPIRFGDFDDHGQIPELIYSDAEEFNFDYINEAIDFAKNAGIKFEVLWFGTDTCSLSTDQRVPVHILSNYQKTMKNPTTPLFKKFGADSITGVFGYLMCKNDKDVQRLEAQALQNMFNEIAKRGDDTVIGCQVSNEPGVGLIHGSKQTDHCQCATCLQLKGNMTSAEFREQTMWEYNENLAQAVKESNYPVWTRVNLAESADTEAVKYNEEKRATTGTHIDFIGIDHYRKTPEQLAMIGNNGNQFAQGKNLPMVMELGQKDNRGGGLYLAEDTLATYSGGSFVHIYDMLSSDGCQIYQLDNNQPNTFKPMDNEILNLFKVNKMLEKIGFDIATKLPNIEGQNRLVYFNGTSSVTNFSDTKHVGNHPVNFVTQNNGVGIAVYKNTKELALLSTKEGDQFVLPTLGKTDIEQIELGYYDTDDNWVKESDIEITETNGKATVRVPAYGCVKVTTKEAKDPIDVVEFKVEAENRTVSEASIEQWNDGACGGAWVKVNAKNIGDSAAVSVDVAQNGVYDFSTTYYGATNRATVQIYVDGKKLATQSICIMVKKVTTILQLFQFH